jgi:benzil reductase ((S)-benzoin forming)
MKHILVTGSSRGFGKEIAKELAAPDTRLYLVARSTSRLTREQVQDRGGEATEYQRDLTDQEQVENLMEMFFSAIDENDADMIGLVNNAGTLNPIGPLGKYGAEEYRNNLEINFTAPAILTHLFIQKFQDIDIEKRVVFISSGAANKPYEGWSHYCSTKAGIDMLMHTVHKEQQRRSHPVKVMGFNPGRIETDMQELIRMQDKEDFPAVQDFIEAKHDGRTSSASDLAAVLAQFMTRADFPSGRIINGKKYLQ